MPITAVQSNEAMDDGPPSVTSAAADVPAWLAARRERQVAGEAVEVTSADEPLPLMTFPPPVPRRERPSNGEVLEASSQVGEVDEAIDMSSAAELPPLITFPPAIPQKKRKRPVPIIDIEHQKKPDDGPPGHWLTQWISRQGLIGIGVSLLIHATVLVALGFIIMSHVSKHEEMSLWGNVVDGDDVGGDLLVDTSTPNDAGEPAPIQMMDLGKPIEGLGPGKDFAESMRVGASGKGTGDGESGEGMGKGVGSLRIPGHAQTKGSFSAWPEPRDPQPGQKYDIVIQIRLPRAAKKYRASDLSGLVTGTDKYKQEIRYKAGVQFPVEDGVVEIRISVPGGGKSVRDTILVESKLLKEKQQFEIEF